MSLAIHLYSMLGGAEKPRRVQMKKLLSFREMGAESGVGVG